MKFLDFPAVKTSKLGAEQVETRVPCELDMLTQISTFLLNDLFLVLSPGKEHLSQRQRRVIYSQLTIGAGIEIDQPLFIKGCHFVAQSVTVGKPPVFGLGDAFINEDAPI